MDDLSGLDWSSTNSSNNQTSKPPPMNPSSAFSYATLRPTPSPLASGRNTPLSTQGSGSASAAFKPPAAKPAQDSFSNLMNFGPTKNTANLSLREQQERLEAEKRRKEEEKRKQAHANYGDGQFFDVLGQRSSGNSRTASPAIPPRPTLGSLSAQNGKPTDADDDLFAAFKAETKVDNASHYPPPAQNGSGKSTPANAPGPDLRNPAAWGGPAVPPEGAGFAEDDDPFGLNQLKPKPQGAPAAAAAAAPLDQDQDEDDDLLGDLGRPIEEVRRKAEAQRTNLEPGKPIEDSDSDSSDADQGRARPSDDPFDKAVSQLVDYGFSPEDARRGLTESGAGLSVQAAANWLLDDAHRKAKEKSRGKQPPASQPGGGGASSERRGDRARNASPAWMRDEDAPSRGDSRSPAQGDGDFAKTAAAVGTSFLKTANSLWKTGQKKVQKAVQEFQQDADPSQPKWMRSTQQDLPAAGDRQKRRPDATDEAMMLDSGMRPDRRQGRSGLDSGSRPESAASSRNQSPAMSSGRTTSAVPKWQQGGGGSQPSLLDPRSRLSRLAAEEESAQVYISPARRKKSPQPPAEPAAKVSPSPQPEADLLFNSAAPPPPQQQRASPANSLPNRPASKPSPQPRRAAATPTPPRPTRQIPQVNGLALQASAKHRADGTAHFKRGDYAAAHASYSASLTGIPATHPLVAVLLCNRALTALKTGEPRQAVDDADAALAVIGPGRGEGETVALEDGTTDRRDMRDLYGKALTRKAEALEQMEKWADAGAAWLACVEAGVGGAAATAGRQRCQKALAPKPAAKPAAATRPRPRPTAATRSSSASQGGGSSEAVERLRAANKAAERADDEKFALVDQVDARIAAWRDGKRENLRALLGSLDQVLWANSGWKKVGLHELVVANRVKVVYMKAIAKTHPDKVCFVFLFLSFLFLFLGPLSPTVPGCRALGGPYLLLLFIRNTVLVVRDDRS